MNVLLSYLIVSFFAQISNGNFSSGEVLPSPSLRGSPGAATNIMAPPSIAAPLTTSGNGLVNPAILPGNMSSPAFANSDSPTKIGWGTDPENLFCLIIQISPDAIASFAQGQNGQELPVNIPPEFRDRFQRVVIRVGTGDVERNPPNPASLSSSRNNAPAMIANLDNRSGFENRTPVSIDRSSELITTSGTGQLGSPSLSAAAAPNSGPAPYVPTQNQVLPNTMASPVNTNPFDRNSAPSLTNPNSLSDAGSRFVNTPQQSPTGFGGTGRSPTDEVFPPGSAARQDDFLPKSPNRSTTFDFLKTNGSQGYATNGAGGYATSTNPNLNARNSAQAPYLASNPNQPPLNGFNDSSYAGAQGSYPPPQYQQTTYPQTNTSAPYQVPTVNPNPYAMPNAPGLTPNLPQTPPVYRTAGASGGAVTPPPYLPAPEHNEVNAAPRNNLIQFLLLFSIIGNVYLGCWMGYLRQRYRELLCNMRGIPIADLDT
jgi:hypothetical protein